MNNFGRLWDLGLLLVIWYLVPDDLGQGKNVLQCELKEVAGGMDKGLVGLCMKHGLADSWLLLLEMN